MAVITCYRGIAHTWLCDHLGHLNTRYYVGMFDDAMQHFFHLLGYKRDPKYGWADVKHEIEYQAEVKVGTLVHIDCELIKVGGKSITFIQRMYKSESGELCATNTSVTVLLDTEKGSAVPVPDSIRAHAAE